MEELTVLDKVVLDMDFEAIKRGEEGITLKGMTNRMDYLENKGFDTSEYIFQISEYVLDRIGRTG